MRGCYLYTFGHAAARLVSFDPHVGRCGVGGERFGFSQMVRRDSVEAERASSPLPCLEYIFRDNRGLSALVGGGLGTKGGRGSHNF